MTRMCGDNRDEEIKSLKEQVAQMDMKMVNHNVERQILSAVWKVSWGA